MSSEPYAIPPKDRAFEGILWYIKHYDLQGGDRLPAERVLCEELGVSRTALRAAITRLISCGTLCVPSQAAEHLPGNMELYPGRREGRLKVDRAFGLVQGRVCRYRFGPKGPDRSGFAALLHAARARGQWLPGVDRDGLRQPVFVPITILSRRASTTFCSKRATFT